MATLSISEQFAMMRRFDGLYHVRGNGQSHEEGLASVNEWAREGEPTPVQVMKAWKRERKPIIKSNIAKTQIVLSDIEDNIANNKCVITHDLDSLRDAQNLTGFYSVYEITAEDAAEDVGSLKIRLAAVMNDQKLQLARKKFFKYFIKALSHAHNENIAKACKYSAKAEAVSEGLAQGSAHGQERGDVTVGECAKYDSADYLLFMGMLLRQLPLVKSARIERDDMRRLRAECESLQKEGGGGGKLGVVMSFA